MSDDDRYRRFNLRIPKDLFAHLQRAADSHSHSMNAEIVHRLEESAMADSYDNEAASQLIRSAKLYQDAYALHMLVSKTENKETREMLEHARDVLVREYEALKSRQGYVRMGGKYPWED